MLMVAGISLLCLAGVACVETGDESPIEVPALYAREIEAWRVDRHQRLVRPDSWLSLAGLFWLREG
ncbi:MAG: DUF1684 domain-containing protein, partial [bacterium]|nr:DUF1684 domain-containing protein [bacterium]